MYSQELSESLLLHQNIRRIYIRFWGSISHYMRCRRLPYTYEPRGCGAGVKTVISKIRQKLRHLPRRQLIAQNTLGCSRADGQFRAAAGAYNSRGKSLVLAGCNCLQFFVNGCSLHALPSSLHTRPGLFDSTMTSL